MKMLRNYEEVFQMGSTLTIVSWTVMLLLIGGEIIRGIFMFRH